MNCNRDNGDGERERDNICDRGNNDVHKIELRQSDFSIEHILNRAGGDRCTNLENCSYCPKINLSYISSETPVQFNWLQYTRYHPPKLPRPFRHTPAKRTPGRLPRIPFTPYQLSTLEEAYKISSYLSSEDATKLARKLNLTSTRVKIWFQNRRARERREHKTKENSELEYL